MSIYRNRRSQLMLEVCAAETALSRALDRYPEHSTEVQDARALCSAAIRRVQAVESGCDAIRVPGAPHHRAVSEDVFDAVAIQLQRLQDEHPTERYHRCLLCHAIDLDECVCGFDSD